MFMRQAKVVIGANFGDEGKGLMTDYFCRSYPSDQPVLNVRFNGGAQAGHTVVTPDGRRHVFSHFGAGSFLPNVATYLAYDFIVNPILFRREYEELVRLGVRPLVYMHPHCLLTVPQDMMINQIIERHRGGLRHGSCGVGIYETQYRSKHNRKLWLESICHGNCTPFLNDRDFSTWHLEDMGARSLSDHDKMLLTNQNITAHYLEDVRFLKEHVIIADDSIYHRFKYVVFEAGQGLMLDQQNMDYFPHLTPSNTGTKNLVDFIPRFDSFEVCYVTRPYFTRHGAGRFDQECMRESVRAGIDQTNHHNEFQGSFRYGYFDPDVFASSITKDQQNYKHHCHAFSTIALTHADESGWQFVAASGSIPVHEHTFPFAPMRYVSAGVTAKTVFSIR
jgi:adenylosuccinate synthase